MSTARLRQVVDADHAWLVDLHNDPIVLRNLTSPDPITLDHHRRWWLRTEADPSQLRLLFCIDDERIGFAKFYNIDHTNRSCVLGADIHAKHRGRGLAKVLWTLMLNRAFNVLDMHRVSLSTAEYNVVARRVYDALGFQVEGRFVQSLQRDGVFHDQVLMYMLKDDWVINGENFRGHPLLG